MEGPQIGVYTVLREFSKQGDALALGRLLACVTDLLHPGCAKRGLLKVLLASGLRGHLYSAEFLEGVGRSRLNTRRLIRHTFVHSEGAAEASRGLLALSAAGVLNLHSRRALQELHAGMAGWHMDGRTLLLGRLASEFESFTQLGLFLRLLLDAPGCPPGQGEALVRGVLALEDVRDLVGSSKELKEALPEFQGIIDQALQAEEAASDEDEEGNLQGFVCGDDEVEYSSLDEGEVEEDSSPVHVRKRAREASGGAAVKQRLKKLLQAQWQ
jgi:hypothetical protein